METISYKGKVYPKLTFKASHHGDTFKYTISVESLSDAIGVGEDDLEGEEASIDQSIYFYLKDDVIDLDIREICKDHLDIEMEFVSMEEDEDEIM